MRGYFFGTLTIPLFFALGTFLSHLSDSRNNTHFFANQLNKDSLNFYHLRIVEPPIVKKAWVKCEVEIMGVNNSTATGKALIYFQKNDTSQLLKYGDNIYAQINFFEINEPLNPHEFNYKNYLLLHDIHHQAFVHSGNWIKAGSDPNSLFEFIYSVKDRCNKIIEQSGMSAENISVAKALLLGDKNLIDAELMLSYAAAGALHVLAVSGLHVGIVMLILTFIFTPIKRIKNGKIIFVVLALCGVWFYAIITGLSPSVLRAAVMFSFVIVGNELQRDTNIYQSLLVSAFFLILIDPTIIFKIGFLLSYLAVLGIVFFHPKIYGLFHFKNFFSIKSGK